MDKTFNSLMDIVNRTKKFDSKPAKPAPSKPAKPVVKEEVAEIPNVADIGFEEPKEKPAPKRKTTTSSPSPFASSKAISSLLSKGKKPAPVKKKEPSTPKPEPKKEVVKEVKTEEIVEEKETPKKTVSKPQPKVTYEDPRSAQLYAALHNSLFRDGTDVSEFMSDDEELEETQNNIIEERAKKEAEKLNAEITKEQQEYEQLFNGSMGSEEEEETEEEVVEESTPVKSYLTRKEMEDREALEIDAGNDINQKIVDYYKRKQEKIDQYNAMEEEGYTEPEKNNDEDAPVDYDAIFNSNEITTRNELLGIESEETTEVVDDNSEVEENKVSATDYTNFWNSQVGNAKNGTEENSYTLNLQEDTSEYKIDENNSVFTNPVKLVNEVEEPIKNTKEPEINSEKGPEEIEQYSSVSAEEMEASGLISSRIESNENTIESSPLDETFTDTDGVVVDSENTVDSLGDTNPDSRYDLSGDNIEFEDFIVKGNSTKNNNSFPEQDSLEESESLSTETNLFENTVEPIVASQESDMFNKEPEIIDNNVLDSTNSEIAEILESAENNTNINESLNDYDSIINNEKVYEENLRSNQTDEILYNANFVDNSSNNTFIMSELPENKFDLFGNTLASDEEPNKDDSISKSEFYNEMARLQENLLSELRGEKVETSSHDFFAEEEPKEEQPATKVKDEKAEAFVKAMLDAYGMEENDEESEENLKDTSSEDNESVDSIDSEETATTDEVIIKEPAVGSKAEPVDPALFDEYNLLNKDVALSEDDIIEETTEEIEGEAKATESYFYMSTEDKEKKAQVTDEYLNIYNEEMGAKEVGDINIFKSIGNAVPSSEVLKNQDQDSTLSQQKDDEEVETIYTLMGIDRRSYVKEKENMKVLYVASECQPFIASGGLADVAGSLPRAIAEQSDIDMRVILPLYGNIKKDYKDKFEYLGNFTVHLSWRQEYCGLFRFYKDGVTYYFIDNERYFKRDSLYGYFDDGERFAYFSRAVVEALPYLNFFPDIIHCNDWQSSLVSAYIKTENWSDFRYYKIRHIYTIHNVEYQGIYGMENLKDLFGIDYRFKNEVEYNGDINLTKTAIQYADKFTTVSNSYCDNLKQPYCSRGLHHIIIRNDYKLSGIINGIDYDFYNPATDPHIFKNYDKLVLDDKVLNKKMWQDEIGLPVDGETPMIAIVSRLVGHKGIDLVTKIINNVLTKDVQLVVVGTGDEKYVEFFKNLENRYPTKVRVFVDSYSNEIARKAYAASDIFVMPSKIEPCGLSQMIASRYGSVPIVREVGGLKDSIKDFGCVEGGNGYTFTNYNPNDLEYQINRAIRDYSNRSEWKEKMKICMNQDFTWKKPAEEYIKLYKSVCDK